MKLRKYILLLVVLFFSLAGNAADFKISGEYNLKFFHQNNKQIDIKKDEGLNFILKIEPKEEFNWAVSFFLKDNLCLKFTLILKNNLLYIKNIHKEKKNMVKFDVIEMKGRDFVKVISNFLFSDLIPKDKFDFILKEQKKRDSTVELIPTKMSFSGVSDFKITGDREKLILRAESRKVTEGMSLLHDFSSLSMKRITYTKTGENYSLNKVEIESFYKPEKPPARGLFLGHYLIYITKQNKK